MPPVKKLHREAMEFVDLAQVAKRVGDFSEYRRLMGQAFAKERLASKEFWYEPDTEPTRSVLIRSAASMAYECGQLRDAEQLIAIGLMGNPPEEIKDELRDLFEQVNFHRHLHLRGVTLSPVELQMSISGHSIGFGFSESSEFVSRVQTTERLVLRTFERKKGIPYRTVGRPPTTLCPLYLGPGREGSYSVTFHIGQPTDQMMLFPDHPESFQQKDEVVAELVDCFELFEHNALDQLRERIKNDSYYTNFVSQAELLAPDGENVRSVGFTAIQEGKPRSVQLVTPRRELNIEVPIAGRTDILPVLPPEEPKIVELEGQLLKASALEDLVTVVDDNKKHQRIKVPEGLDDVVTTLWRHRVVVVAEFDGKRFVARNIRKA